MNINREKLQNKVTEALLGEIMKRPEVTELINNAMKKIKKENTPSVTVDLYAAYKILRDRGLSEPDAFQCLQEIYNAKEGEHG